MGTRHLTCVVLNGEFKIAQYGQWDGYPEGAGLIIADFVRDLIANKTLEKFEGIVQNLHPISDNEYRNLWIEFGVDLDSEKLLNWPTEQFFRKYPQFSRDTGSYILNLTLDQKIDTVELDIRFGADSLFCEWGYVIDLDRFVLEVYRGFVKKPHNDGRFAHLETEDNKYYPIQKVVEFSIHDMPNNEDYVKIINNAVELSDKKEGELSDKEESTVDSGIVAEGEL